MFAWEQHREFWYLWNLWALQNINDFMFHSFSELAEPQKKLFYNIFSRRVVFCCFLSMIKCCISGVANTVARDPVVRWREMRQENAENNDAKMERYIYSMEHECGWDGSREIWIAIILISHASFMFLEAVNELNEESPGCPPLPLSRVPCWALVIVPDCDEFWSSIICCWRLFSLERSERPPIYCRSYYKIHGI